MIKDILRFARLIENINELSNHLDMCRDSFYDGGKSFEQIYTTDLEDLERMCLELKELMLKIK